MTKLLAVAGSIVIFSTLGTVALPEDTKTTSSSWSSFASEKLKDAGYIWQTTKDGTSTLWETTKGSAMVVFSATKDGAAAAASYAGDKFIIAEEVSSAWTKEQFDEFQSNHPKIVSNINDLGAYLDEAGGIILEKGKGEAVIAYEYTSDGAKAAVDWSTDRLEKLPKLTACGVAEYDLLGGVAIGTLGTSIAAGTATSTVVALIPGILAHGFVGYVPVAVAVVSYPVIATGVTVTALAGATVYATANGICYFSDKEDSNQ
jgi:hypothetical protein